jgi:FkbM family methyltransferase
MKRRLINGQFRKRIKDILSVLFGYKIFSHAYYSQDGEDVLLSTFYETMHNYKGFYVDIGAYHPIHLSNTALFYKRGWRGVNIDALPGSMKAFHKIRTRDINIESGVSDEYGELSYYVFGATSTVNSFSEELSAKLVDSGEKIEKIIRIKVQPINDILEKHLKENQHIDFITIDVEGFELRILQSFNFEKYAPNYFLIEELEYTNKDFMQYYESPIYTILKDKGYIVAAKTKRTVIYKKLNMN